MTHASADAPTSPRVFVPPPLTSVKLFDGLIGSSEEDFVVDEIPAYPFDGEGEHWLVQIRKRGLNTADVAKILAQVSKSRERDVGIAGQKDKQAVTTQWFSLSTVGTVPPAEWELPDGVSVVQVTKHRNKLRTGHLHGNRFRIRLVGTCLGTVDEIRNIAAGLADSGVPNYYGAQRFGWGLTNLDKALAWLERQGRGGGKGSRFVAKWMPSVIQAEIFNRYLRERIALGLDRLLTGEIVRLSGSSRHFEVDDPQVEQPRLASRDIVLSGPMVGPKTKGATREALEVERKVIAELGLTDADLALLGQHAPGARRDLLMWPEQLTTEFMADGSLVLEFALPAGSYATVLVAEFAHCPFGHERQRVAGGPAGASLREDGRNDDDD